MPRLDALIEEFIRETATTRRHLERLPESHFDWRPHAKSFTIGQLGGHITECVRWTEMVFAGDALDMNPSAYEVIRPNSVAELLAVFDATVERAAQTMGRSTDREASSPWQMKLHGSLLFEKDRESAFRDMSLSHLIHHRGQFTVYLRLLDVPLAGTYGPTADQRG